MGGVWAVYMRGSGKLAGMIYTELSMRLSGSFRIILEEVTDG